MIKDRLRQLYPLRIITHIYRLPRYIEFFEKQNHERTTDVINTQNHLVSVREKLNSSQQDIEDIKRSLSTLPSIDARLVNLQDRFTKLKAPRTHSGNSAPIVNNTVADNHEFDYFYKLFEDRFRGSEEIIKERVAEHIPLFKALSKEVQKLAVIDIGCGRGEFLSVLKDNSIHGIGVDMNKSMVERARKLGLDAEENDALTYLSSKKTNSFAAITGFHIVEHIPFEVLMKIFEESYRTITPGGFALFETPNPEALTVGANTFYLDPSHQRPIPPKLLAFMLESVGFVPEIIPLHRVRPELKTNNKPLSELYESLYGPGDYAVVARKIS